MIQSKSDPDKEYWRGVTFARRLKQISEKNAKMKNYLAEITQIVKESENQFFVAGFSDKLEGLV